MSLVYINCRSYGSFSFFFYFNKHEKKLTKASVSGNRSKTLAILSKHRTKCVAAFENMEEKAVLEIRIC